MSGQCLVITELVKHQWTSLLSGSAENFDVFFILLRINIVHTNTGREKLKFYFSNFVKEFLELIKVLRKYNKRREREDAGSKMPEYSVLFILPRMFLYYYNIRLIIHCYIQHWIKRNSMEHILVCS